MLIKHKDKPTDESEFSYLKSHIFETVGFYIQSLILKDEYTCIEPTLPIPKFKSTAEVADTIRKFVDSQKAMAGKKS